MERNHPVSLGLAVLALTRVQTQDASCSGSLFRCGEEGAPLRGETAGRSCGPTSAAAVGQRSSGGGGGGGGTVHELLEQEGVVLVGGVRHWLRSWRAILTLENPPCISLIVEQIPKLQSFIITCPCRFGDCFYWKLLPEYM